MKSVKMKGKNVDEATEAALAVLGISKDQAVVRTINEGKPGVMGLLGGEEAEVEVIVKEGGGEEARQTLQNILDKMGLLAVAEITGEAEGEAKLAVKGEDMGRIIGKEGAMLKSLELVVGSIVRKIVGAPVRVRIDAGGYMEKREKVLQKLAAEVAEEVEKSGRERVLPYMEASDRRVIHLFIQDKTNLKSYSVGEGKERRMVIAPK
ncbi:MAG: KH domain-containing protein [Candidatus Saganbacteria bacterium]|nr:KH domain-containing protein [Candidatus Saganbacteria bacterium]